ncbi:MAG: transposase family protein [Thermodesulfobacteriota bacterium]|nr:transposase family protein [Thermodesulfobacteriota bacterium]
MRDIDLFQMAFGLTPPWQMSDAQFNPNTKRLDIKIDFPRLTIFICPKCGQTGIKAYDTQKKSWRHLNLFQHEAYLTDRVPKIDCNDCGTLLVDVTWARSGGGFTLLFEAMILSLAKSMPVKSIGEFVNEHDTR